MTTGVRSGMDWIRFIRLLDLQLHHVLISCVMEMEQMMKCLLAKIDTRMDANTKTMSGKWMPILKQ
jgi:hypothetical protein